jgi:NAD(P)-dependent dehydrogenase (short-subunit alcohol dehydrogenase family)
VRIEGSTALVTGANRGLGRRFAEALPLRGARVYAVHDVMIAAGVEHMGRVPMRSNVAHPDEFGMPYPPELMARDDPIPKGLSAELIAERWQVSRAEQDELGLRSHQLAARATDEGRFDREIIPMNVDAQTSAPMTASAATRVLTRSPRLCTGHDRGRLWCPVEGDALPRPRPLVNE